ncbi:hypothetical protein [Mycobacterium sp. SA01]|uniref:hypothetical protein n=1 Tax=Mycobacterium sp. SA01 TaxID=3238820 RepID=UPI00351AE67D
MASPGFGPAATLLMTSLGEVGVLADAAATATTGPTWIQFLTILGFGSLLAAIVTAELTRRRERSKWLAERKIEANQNFHRTALKLAHLAREGISEEDRLKVLGTVRDLEAELLQQYQALMLVADVPVVTMAGVVSDHLDKLAFQALPLPRTTHAASLEQREQALTAVGELMFELGMTMRIASKFAGRQEKKQFLEHRTPKLYAQQVHSIVDRDGPKPDLLQVLRDWEVTSMARGEIPSDLNGYRNGSPEGGLPYLPGHFVVAMLRKPHDGFWRFNMCWGNGPLREQQILEDVVRLVTGHGSVFEPLHAHSHRVEDDPEDELNGHTWLWTTLELNSFHPVYPEVDGDILRPTKLSRLNRIVHKLRGGSPKRTAEPSELRVIAIRKSDTLPDSPASHSWPRLGAYTKYVFEVELSREPTRGEIESGQMFFNSSDFTFVPPKTLRFVSTTEEMEQRVPGILFMSAMARQAIAGGREMAKQSREAATAEEARVGEALIRMNALIRDDTGLSGGEYFGQELKKAFETLEREGKIRIDPVTGTAIPVTDEADLSNEAEAETSIPQDAKGDEP